MHGDGGSSTGVDAARGAELRDGEQVDARSLGRGGQARTLLAEDQYALSRDVVGLHGHRTLDIVDADERQA
jgi:hypothetical protein